MESYSVLVKRSAAKELEAMAEKDRGRIVRRIATLKAAPRPAGCEKLSDQARYRIRLGNYRILYQIDDAMKVVTIVKIGDRKDVYRRD